MYKHEGNKILHEMYKRAESSKRDSRDLSQLTYSELRAQLSHYRIKFRLTEDQEYLKEAIALDKEITERLLS